MKHAVHKGKHGVSVAVRAGFGWLGYWHGPGILPALSLSDGTTNTINATLNVSQKSSFDLSVKGSEWAPLFQNVGPGPASPVDASVVLFAQAFASGNVLGVNTPFAVNLPLFFPNLTSSGGGFLVGAPRVGSCNDSAQFNPTLSVTAHAPILTDEDFGMLQYGDPFPSGWLRVFSFCQTATVELPGLGSSATTTVRFGSGENTGVPASPISPLVFPVQNPTINGLSLFTATTLNTTAATLSWSQPVGPAPSGYKIAMFASGSLPDGSMGYLPAGRLETAKTSAILPSLQAGTYVFVITARVDAGANVETSPNRSGLPNGFASVVTAPVTISSTASRI